jgi:phosphate transport system permease protein
VATGGISVIIAILLIFFYLLYIVVPMFGSADIKQGVSYAAPGEGATLILGLEEQGTIAVRFTDQGHAVFFNTTTGDVIADKSLNLSTRISSVATNLNLVVLGLEDGSVLAVRYQFDLSYPDDVRVLTPRLDYPLGLQPLVLDESGQALTQIAIQLNEDVVGLVATTADNRLVSARYLREESFLDDEVSIELESRSEQVVAAGVRSIALAPALNHVYVALENGVLIDYTLDEEGFDGGQTKHQFDHEISQLKLLLGGSSLMIGLANGEIQQWMSVRKESGRAFIFIRNFDNSQQAVTAIATEQRRKGFAVADVQGDITIYYSTSQRTLVNINTANTAIEQMAWSARAQHLLVADNTNQLHLYHVHNEYPEISFSVLWEKVWYEGYDEADYIWQSSASNDDFEPKFSLVPLSFGTIKAAFYAMLFAIPIAILGAIYTAQFMAPKMRQSVKPTIEIMEALPTVILGFLAGLWLAPYIEVHLAGVFTLFLVLPVGFILCAALWTLVPNKSMFEGWEAAILIPVVVFLFWVSMQLSGPLEMLLFEGDLRHYMSNEWGWTYDQRNALVIGVMMGFAVIPTIFSIAEDALFSVPQHLVRGSLALGATRWQTLMTVVLPTASPGIFSAVMMGFGRAVGETMIVLMATGNTPIMDMSIFQGMRTLAANLAVEVPEAEVFSTHYRVLFLAALILFLFTFVFNTFAEIIRHRLRKRYSGL